MFKELLSAFRTSDPLSAMGSSFSQMLSLTHQMTVTAGELLVAGTADSVKRTELYQRDVQVNQLERTIRKQVVAHLALTTNRSEVPYCLLLASLVKDVERIGDYAKNLTEVVDVQAGPFPDDELTRELLEIKQGVEESFKAVSDVLRTSDQARASALIRQGRDLAKRCDTLIIRIARSSHDAGTATALALATRYYKRIGGHVLNVLSSVVMPLHKIDYFDEDAVPEGMSLEDSGSR